MSMEEEAITLMRQYEQATATKIFSNVAPLIDSNAFYRFTDGDFVGINAIEEAFNHTWNTIKNEIYKLDNFSVVVWNNDLASVAYTFTWQGMVDGLEKSGSGKGFNTLTRRPDGSLVIWNEILSK